MTRHEGAEQPEWQNLAGRGEAEKTVSVGQGLGRTGGEEPRMWRCACQRGGSGGGWAAGQGGEEDAALRGPERDSSGNMDEN